MSPSGARVVTADLFGRQCGQILELTRVVGELVAAAGQDAQAAQVERVRDIEGALAEIKRGEGTSISELRSPLELRPASAAAGPAEVPAEALQSIERLSAEVQQLYGTLANLGREACIARTEAHTAVTHAGDARSLADGLEARVEASAREIRRAQESAAEGIQRVAADVEACRSRAETSAAELREAFRSLGDKADGETVAKQQQARAESPEETHEPHAAAVRAAGSDQASSRLEDIPPSWRTLMEDVVRRSQWACEETRREIARRGDQQVAAVKEAVKATEAGLRQASERAEEALKAAERAAEAAREGDEAVEKKVLRWESDLRRESQAQEEVVANLQAALLRLEQRAREELQKACTKLCQQAARDAEASQEALQSLEPKLQEALEAQEQRLCEAAEAQARRCGALEEASSGHSRELQAMAGRADADDAAAVRAELAELEAGLRAYAQRLRSLEPFREDAERRLEELAAAHGAREAQGEQVERALAAAQASLEATEVLRGGLEEVGETAQASLAAAEAARESAAESKCFAEDALATARASREGSEEALATARASREGSEEALATARASLESSEESKRRAEEAVAAQAHPCAAEMAGGSSDGGGPPDTAEAGLRLAEEAAVQARSAVAEKLQQLDDFAERLQGAALEEVRSMLSERSDELKALGERLREDVLEEARFLMSRQCTELRMFAEKLREVMVEEMRGVLSRPPPSPSGAVGLPKCREAPPRSPSGSSGAALRPQPPSPRRAGAGVPPPSPRCSAGGGGVGAARALRQA